MDFNDVWKQVKGLPDTAMVQVPGCLSEASKKKLTVLSPEKIAEIVGSAIDEVNHGSIAPLDELIKKRL